MKRHADGGYALGQPMGTVRGLRYGEGVEANDERSILKAKPRRMPNFDKWISQAYSRGSVGPSKKRVDSALAFAISEYQFFAGEEYNPKGLVEVVKEVLYDVDQMVDGAGEDIMPSFPARQVEKEFWGWFKAVYPEDSEGFKAAAKTGEDLADSDELAKTWFNTEDPEEGVEDSGAGGAAHLFFDNPNKRETREFAESGADSNDPDSSDGDKTPPTPTEIREDEAGGEAFSTLNRLVVETDHPTEDEMPEGHDDVEKSEKVLKQAGMPDPRYLAKGLLKVDPDPKYAGGMQCPFCGSDAVSYMTGRDEGLEIRGSQAHHSLQCYNCHSHWEEHFSLKLKKMDVRKYPSKVLQSKPVDASPVGRTKIWSVGKSAASSLLDAWGIIGEDE